MAVPRTAHDPAARLARAPGDKDAIRRALQEARERTWTLVDGLADQELEAAATGFLSPPVWDLGHMANFEELWLVQRLLGCGELREGFNDTYNAFEHPRPERPRLDLLDRDGVQTYMEEVRDRTLTVLDALALDGDPLTRDGFIHWMLVLHEHQHQETLLQSIQLHGAAGRYRLPAVRRLPDPRPVEPGFVAVPEGPFVMGTHHVPGVYDNEAPPHTVDVPAFEMGRFPVTCGEYLRFMEDGGYDDPGLWSERGRDWLADTGVRAPRYWRQDPDRGGAWIRDGPGCRVPVADWPDVILSHVTWFEAQAYATWAGARLPTEAEWEKACRWDPDTGETVGRDPWGDAPADPQRANVDQLAFAPSRIGAYPDGTSPMGCEHMIGDVWEWTASGFDAYPGFRPHPYPEYSQVFFGGDHRVLRGGSWATRPPCANGTFRNWDHPYRRQIFSGIRLARDA